MSMISDVDHNNNGSIYRADPMNVNDGTSVGTDHTTFKSHVVDDVQHCGEEHSIMMMMQNEPPPQLHLPSITFIAKYGKERFTFTNLHPHTTIGQVKDMIQVQTRILPVRQKFVGLSAKIGGTKGVTDTLPISELAVKTSTIGSNKSTSPDTLQKDTTTGTAIVHQFILMGTPEEQIFIDPSQKDDLPDIIDDFDFDFNAGSDEWIQHRANDINLKQFTQQTPIHIMNEPRPDKPLLVLDLDHTLLDFSSKSLQQDTTTRIPGQGLAASMKRPFMDDFLTTCYRHYDIVVWSQTSWRWLETKLIELGMVTHPGYKFCFVLDKTSMFTVVSTKRDGTKVKHHVKPLQIIWSKFPDRWGTHNTVHIDDLSRNFALNLDNGLQCSAYHRKKKKNSSSSSSRTSGSSATNGSRDTELVGLGKYLIQLVESGITFHNVNFTQWTDVVSGTKTITEKKKNGK